MTEKTAALAKQCARRKAIALSWADYCTVHYGDPLPRNYIAIDTETTGLRPDYDLPWEFGWCLVRDGEVASRGEVVINWPLHSAVSDEWFRNRANEMMEKMASRGKPSMFSWQRLREEGLHPDKAMDFICQMLQENRKAQSAFVSQNGWFFDAPMLERALLEFADCQWRFEPNEMFDTGCLEKASLLDADRYDVFPFEGESMRDFFLRIRDIRAKGVFWSAEACLERHGLCERFGLSPGELHGAGMDSYVCSLMFEENR